MSQYSNGSSQSAKHVWTVDEDKLLVQCLVQLKVEQKYMADNGFKPGYLQALESMLQERCPGWSFKGIPHIQSRLKTLKTSWSIVFDMVYGTNTSGFGYDNNTHCVTADKAVWDTYIQTHKKAAPFRNKHFYHFEDLCIVWGKDRATGKDAHSACDVIEEMAVENEGAGLEDLEDTNIFQDPLAEMACSEVSSSPANDSSSGSRKRRRRHEDPFIQAFQLATDKFVRSVKRVFVDTELNARRERLYSELEKVGDLTRQERRMAHITILQNDRLLVGFPSIPDEEKAEWIRDIIR